MQESKGGVFQVSCTNTHTPLGTQRCTCTGTHIHGVHAWITHRRASSPEDPKSCAVSVSVWPSWFSCFNHRIHQTTRPFPFLPSSQPAMEEHLLTALFHVLTWCTISLKNKASWQHLRVTYTRPSNANDHPHPLCTAVLKCVGILQVNGVVFQL